MTCLGPVLALYLRTIVAKELNLVVEIVVTVGVERRFWIGIDKK